MGDESQRDYDQYIAELPKAEVVWLKGCRICKTTGMVQYEAFHTDSPHSVENRSVPCGCITHFMCPQCGKKHGKPFFAVVGEILQHCWLCGWSKK